MRRILALVICIFLFALPVSAANAATKAGDTIVLLEDVVLEEDAVLNIESFNAGALFSYTLFNISTNERIAANKLSVTFSATFSLTMSYGSLNVPGLTWWEEDFGPYTGSVTGYTI